jgi:hypothetical protein
MDRLDIADMIHNLNRALSKITDKKPLSMAQDLYLHEFLARAIAREDEPSIFLEIISIKQKMSRRLELSESENQWLIAYIEGFLTHASNKLLESANALS